MSTNQPTAQPDRDESFELMRLALKEAIDVFDGMNDDEINEELLPRLRAALAAPPPTARADREAIARLVDPEAFDEKLRPKGGLIAADLYDQMRDIARWRADQIIAALYATQQPKQRGETQWR